VNRAGVTRIGRQAGARRFPIEQLARTSFGEKNHWSGREDSNLRPPHPQDDSERIRSFFLCCAMQCHGVHWRSLEFRSQPKVDTKILKTSLFFCRRTSPCPANRLSNQRETWVSRCIGDFEAWRQGGDKFTLSGLGSRRDWCNRSPSQRRRELFTIPTSRGSAFASCRQPPRTETEPRPGLSSIDQGAVDDGFQSAVFPLGVLT
jgi:hypothetical protein